jgi:PAS domain S-box-containing protein
MSGILKPARIKARNPEPKSVPAHKQTAEPLVCKEPASSYLSLLLSLPDAYLAIDGTGSVLEWSPRAAALFGWSASEVIGRSAAELALPESYQRKHPVGLPAFVRLIGRRGNNAPIQNIAINAAGEEFSVELSSILTSETVATQRFLVLIKDISPRLIADERLAQAAKMEAIGQLVSGLAHDFNNILGIILGGLETLEVQLKDPTSRELVKLAILATERGNEVTRAMHAVARRRPAKQERVDINAALKELQPLLQQSAMPRVNVMVIAEASRPEVTIDVGAFNNVMLNFVINARDAMPQGGVAMLYTQNINIRADDPVESIDLEPGEYVVLGIDDTGTGMPPEVLARAMEPFYTTKPKGKGTGLGLAMAYAFALQSGGALRIRSTPGKGTNIHLFIPLLRDVALTDSGAHDD